jgi:organic hydroperoxide reductase OsmC/OhrA
MSEHRLTLTWQRDGRDFTYEGYSRDHVWTFQGGSVVKASAAPEYKGNPALANPEEAFVAALSGCHMLTFLALAAKKRFVVDRYVDHAVGTLEKNAEGRLAITRVVLRPEITFGGESRPTAADLDTLHDQAHHHCFIANSVRTEVTVEHSAGAAV